MGEIATAGRRRPRVSKAGLDSLLPLLTGAAGCLGFALGGEPLFCFMSKQEWNIPSVYSSAFDLFSILTGLLFAVYGIVLTGANPFMRSLRGTKAYARYRLELKLAINLGFWVTLGTVPLLIVEPTEVGRGSWLSFGLSVWIGCVATGLHLFLRVARNFILLVEDVPERPPLAG